MRSLPRSVGRGRRRRRVPIANILVLVLGDLFVFGLGLGPLLLGVLFATRHVLGRGSIDVGLVGGLGVLGFHGGKILAVYSITGLFVGSVGVVVGVDETRVELRRGSRVADGVPIDRATISYREFNRFVSKISAFFHNLPFLLSFLFD